MDPASPETLKALFTGTYLSHGPRINTSLFIILAKK
jgi:hypothetical protein